MAKRIGDIMRELHLSNRELILQAYESVQKDREFAERTKTAKMYMICLASDLSLETVRRGLKELEINL